LWLSGSTSIVLTMISSEKSTTVTGAAAACDGPPHQVGDVRLRRRGVGDREIEAGRRVDADIGGERADEVVIARARPAVVVDDGAGGAVVIDPHEAGFGVAAFGDVPQLAGKRHGSVLCLGAPRADARAKASGRTPRVKS
jgi:hypothetical protein